MFDTCFHLIIFTVAGSCVFIDAGSAHNILPAILIALISLGYLEEFEPDRLIADGTRACGLSLDRATAKILTGTSVTLKWLPLQSQRRRRCEQLSHSRPCYRIADGSSCLNIGAEQCRRLGKRFDRLEWRVKRSARSQSTETGTPGDPTNPNTGKEVEVHDQQQTRNQPSLATGKDLKEANRLVPSKTPE
jgi:hypothetical protein